MACMFRYNTLLSSSKLYKKPIYVIALDPYTWYGSGTIRILRMCTYRARSPRPVSSCNLLKGQKSEEATASFALITPLGRLPYVLIQYVLCMQSVQRLRCTRAETQRRAQVQFSCRAFRQAKITSRPVAKFSRRDPREDCGRGGGGHFSLVMFQGGHNSLRGDIIHQ